MRERRSQPRGDVTRARILKMIELRHRAGHAPPPTMREIAKALKLSTATVHRQIRVLHEMGRIEYAPGLARTIQPRYDD